MSEMLISYQYQHRNRVGEASERCFLSLAVGMSPEESPWCPRTWSLPQRLRRLHKTMLSGLKLSRARRARRGSLPRDYNKPPFTI